MMKRFLFTGITACLLGTTTAQAPFFEKTCYRGAFAPAPAAMWTSGWAEWDPQNKVYPAPTMTVTGNITSNTTWSSGQVVLLSSQCFVQNHSILTIQPGVIVLGDKSANGAGLFVTRGSQLIADGTASQPIVFTSNQAAGQRNYGDWGGVVLLGRSTNNTSGGEGNIEGLPISNDTKYGGATTPDVNDNSGILRYVRIEFGGYVYQPNQEINSLTMGSVGKGTIIDYVQTSFGNDDAFEWFGGTVNAKHLVSFRNLDDDFDTDYGFSGHVQFCLAVRDPQVADNPAVSTSEIFESDNDPSGTGATPKTSAIFSNVTAIGPKRGDPAATVSTGHRRSLRIRRNSELRVYNSVFIDAATRGLFIDGSASETNAQNGTLKFMNNILAGYGQRATESGTAGIITPNLNTWVVAQMNDTLKSSANILTTPYNYTSPDYRPSAGSIAGAGASFADGLIAPVSGTNTAVVLATLPSAICIGQEPSSIQPAVFNAASTLQPGYCSLMWNVPAGVVVSNSVDPSASFTVTGLGSFPIQLVVLSASGSQTVTNTVTTNTCLDVSVKENNWLSTGISVSPNPANNHAVLTVNSLQAENIKLSVHDITGKTMSTLSEETTLRSGENKLGIDTSSLSEGLYFITISNGANHTTAKLVVLK